MRYINIALLLIIISNNANSQEYKRNYTWPVGYEPVVKFHFNGQLFMDEVLNVNLPVAPGCAISNSCSSISDTNGNLQLFSNGFIAYDSDGFGIQNGTYINCPKGTILCNYYGGRSLFDQTSIILPKKNNQYYIFSVGMSDSVATNYLNHVYTEFDILNYSVVDMDSNVDHGKVIEKNRILADYQHYINCTMTAVRHGNGKDWWLVKADCMNHRYQSYLVREDTIEGPYYNNITDTANYCAFWSQIYFSEDGTKLISSIYDNKINGLSYSFDFNRVDVYDFDRCSGIITFKNNYFVPLDSTSYPNYDYKSGICISPNGKLLYMSNIYTIYQIDLEDTNKYNAQLITGPDTSILYFPWYNTMACAPDGRLYIGNFGGTRSFMSYIDSPNVKGLGCHFVPQGLWQSFNINLKSPPNMPNYGLGWNGLCSPLSNAEVERSKQEIIIYPNPANNNLSIVLPTGSKKAEVEVYDMLGQLLLKRSISLIQNDKIVLSVKQLASALYSIKINVDGKQFVSKFVKE